MKEKIIKYSKSYVELCVWLLVFAAGIRLFEAVLLTRINHDFMASIRWNIVGLCYDVSLYLRVSVCVLIVFVAACFLNEKWARIILRIFQSLMLLLSLICIVVFVTSGFLLDKVVFSYSAKAVLNIIKYSTKSPVWVYVMVVAVPLLYFYLSGKRIKIGRVLLTAFAVLMLSSFFIFNKLPTHAYQYHAKVNKEWFFLKSVFKRQTYMFKEDDEQIIKAIEEFRSYFPQHQFAEIEYPFLYKSECNDVLSSFFNLQSDPPNLVFIIFEGLGYEFFKNDYQLMSFLDSLSKKSLTWEYCLSAASATFGIPALFGASPLGEKGFLTQCPNNAEYHSLLKILHQNNYANYFYYGGEMWFDNMGFFCDRNNTAYLKAEDWDSDINKQSIKPTWGYEDHLLYQQSIRKLSQITSSPRVDVFLSLSSHDPYEYPQSTHFQNIVKNKITQNKTLSTQQKKDILNAVNVYGSFAYSDWALQQLMEYYQKRDDFDNTIFIITGDHHALAKQFGGYNNYHVPLIIYSPMLKSARNMKGVVSHRDITPTVLSLLQNNYNIKIPDEVAWLNSALDTSITFNANTFSPLQLLDLSIGGIVYKNYMLCEDVLEELTEGGMRKINNPTVEKQMNRLLSLYKSLDLYVFYNDALIKNSYAHKQRGGNVIIDISDTVGKGSYFAQKSNLPVVEGPQGRKTTLYFDGSYEYPINFIDFNIPDEVEKFRVDIEFKMYIKNNTNEDFNIVVDFNKDNKSAFYLIYKQKPRVQNKWHTFKETAVYKKEDTYSSLGSGGKYILYIWNNNKMEGYIDDIKVKAAVEKTGMD